MSEFQQYEAWFFTVKTRAKYNDIWKFIDPNAEENALREPQEPQRPAVGEDLTGQEEYKY